MIPSTRRLNWNRPSGMRKVVSAVESECRGICQKLDAQSRDKKIVVLASLDSCVFDDPTVVAGCKTTA